VELCLCGIFCFYFQVNDKTVNGYKVMFYYYYFSYIRIMNATTGSTSTLSAAIRFSLLTGIVYKSRK